MPIIRFDSNACESRDIRDLVLEFLSLVQTLEDRECAPVIIFQDGKSSAYYIKCNIRTQDAQELCDTDARLNVNNPEAFRANRELLLDNKTYQKMKEDALEGREFNDIIVEYSTAYEDSRPLKVWGGQHRIHAIMATSGREARYHGFRVYFRLDNAQRTEVALISNTNIAVSNDTFDRMVEQTIFGDVLRKWCEITKLIGVGQDFPDVGSKSELITVKLARTFVVNYYLGKDLGFDLESDDLDDNIYEPYEASSGIDPDPKYETIVNKNEIMLDSALITAGADLPNCIVPSGLL